MAPTVSGNNIRGLCSGRCSRTIKSSNIQASGGGPKLKQETLCYQIFFCKCRKIIIRFTVSSHNQGSVRRTATFVRGIKETLCGAKHSESVAVTLGPHASIVQSKVPQTDMWRTFCTLKLWRTQIHV